MTEIKVTDYIIKTIIDKGVDTIFGYPGGVICHLIDSASKYSNKINIKLNYHEQASAFAACGYAQATGRLAVAFATSGPGATNLITGIANAWYDSLPVLFLTGQVDTYALKSNLKSNIRQYGFQETDIVSIAKPITKYCVQISSPENIVEELNKAIDIALKGRKGPVLIDLPADIQRAYINYEKINNFSSKELTFNNEDFTEIFNSEISKAKRPIILAGAGINQCGLRDEFREFVDKWQLPVVSSMPAVDLIPYGNPLHCGFIGVNGHRYANLILAKSDLVICLGSRLDLKQIGVKRNFFNEKTKIIRFDIDNEELNYPINGKEINIPADLNYTVKKLKEMTPSYDNRDKNWIKIAKDIKRQLEFSNDNEPVHSYIRKICSLIKEDVTYTLDVGQNEGWAAQALEIKNNQKVIMSAGLGTMGYSVPSAIGAYFSTHKPSVAIVGDGGFQMNIQELQFIYSHNLPITIILCNNNALGMIRQFQEKNFNANYQITTIGTGYSVPNFEKVVKAYNIDFQKIENPDDIKEIKLNKPNVIELKLPDKTYLLPGFGKELLYNQVPEIDKTLLFEIMGK